MNKRAVCVGINNYPGDYNDLNGCVNDANDWASLLGNDFGYEIDKILDEAATKSSMLGALESLVNDADDDDLLVFTYSGHGSWEYDKPGNPDESDNRDETLCAYDGNILDDEIRILLKQRPTNAHLTIISDSCHSGTVTRARLIHERDAGTAADPQSAPKPRYMPPENDLDAMRTWLLPIRNRALYPETGMAELLLTGCNALEYSYDAYISGRYNGAMSALTIGLIKSNPNVTYRELHRNLRELLPTAQYPQSPQLEGTDANKDRGLFK